MTRILAVDPGPHTGLAYWDGTSWDSIMIEAKFLTLLLNSVIAFKPDVIVCESFVGSSRNNVHATRTMEIVGMMEALAHVLEAKFVRHTPMARKAFQWQANDMIKARGYKKGHGPHKEDALSHLLMYCKKQGINIT